MSNNLPALSNGQSLLPSSQDLATLKELGTMFIRSGLIPSHIKTPEQAIVIMLKGKEVGLPPLQAFSSISVIKGKPSISSEGMMGLIYKHCPGAVVQFQETTNQTCTIRAARPGQTPSSFSFTMEDAKRAGLLSNDVWRQYPASMLRARCISAMARALFPDCIMGISYTPEELGGEHVLDEETSHYPKPTLQPPPPAAEPEEALHASQFDQAEETVFMPIAPIIQPAKPAIVTRTPKDLLVRAEANGWTKDNLKDYIHEIYSFDSMRDITKPQFDELWNVVGEGTYNQVMAKRDLQNSIVKSVSDKAPFALETDDDLFTEPEAGPLAK